MESNERKIIHIDMDAFFASIEMRDNPTLKTVPIVIARDPRKTHGHGVVATANYLAREYGVHSAMSSAESLKRCQNLVFVEPNFEKYRFVSNQVHQIFHRFTDIIEPVALDEAYLDVTNNKYHIDNHVEIARDIQYQIFEETGLTSSAGVSYNKFLAKLASDYSKPVGLTVIDKEDTLDFLFDLPIEDFRGVGKKTAPRLLELGIKNGRDLYRWNQRDLISELGSFGYVLYQRARGIDNRPVEYKRERKSIGSERTYDTPLSTMNEVQVQLRLTAKRLAEHLTKKSQHGKTLVLKLRDSKFITKTKRTTRTEFIVNSVDEIYDLAVDLYEQISQDSNIDVRLLGLTMTNLAPIEYENISLDLK